MTAVMRSTGRGVLICNGAMPSRYDTCPAQFDAVEGETLVGCEERSRQSGWATVEAFASVAHLCPDHATRKAAS